MFFQKYTYIYIMAESGLGNLVLETNMMLQHGLLQIDLIYGFPAHEQYKAAAA